MTYAARGVPFVPLFLYSSGSESAKLRGFSRIPVSLKITDMAYRLTHHVNLGRRSLSVQGSTPYIWMSTDRFGFDGIY